MAIKDLNDSNKANECSPLINGEINGSVNATQQDSIRQSSGALNNATEKERFRDIRICYFGMFVSSIVFSITISSLWPFLQIVDDTAEATFLGWLVAAFSVGQLIASPIIGYIANRTNSNRMPLVISTALIAISNILYAYGQSIHTPSLSNKWWIMFARFIMGIGAANSTIMRSYASAATTLTERTNVMANLSAYQGVGFILGPLIQALFAFLSFPGPVHQPWLYLNIYTAPAFFSAITAVVNLFLFLLTFKDVRVVSPAKKNINENTSDPKVSSEERHDELLALLCCLYLFFVAYLTFTNYETIASPLSIDMYTWSKEESTRNNGYILGGLGIMSVVVFIATKILAKRYQDRVLLLLGMVICFLGYFVFLPWSGAPPAIEIATFTPPPNSTILPLSSTSSTLSLFSTSSTLPLSSTSSILPTTTTDGDIKGCPFKYDWCYSLPKIQLWQYIIASVVITIGFSICNVICYSIFSKKLGHRPQGTMMGIFTSSGSLARGVGPIAVAFLYKHWGPRVMMIFVLISVLSAIIAVIFNYKRLYIEPEVPDDDDDEENNINRNDDDQINVNNGSVE